MSPQHLFRRARTEDSAAILEFQIAMAWETEKMKLDRGTVTLGIAEVFKHEHRGRYYVAELSGQVVGSLLIIPEWSDWRNGEVWWIHSLYVVPERRGQGVYRGLYAFLKKIAQENKVRGLRLYVDKTNTSAQAVYRKLGMTDEHYSLFESML
jgi:ribosomal protein S18 acetylase RimI-like enzyme